MTNKKTGQVGRPREFDEDEVLGKIMSVFWQFGYEATKLSDIVDATGLRKGSLYKVFSDKQDMYLQALQHYDQNIVQKTVSTLRDETSVPPRERLIAFLSAPINAVWNEQDRRGCFLCNASADFAAHDTDIRNLITRAYNDLETALSVPIKQVNPDWPDKQVEKTAGLFLSVYSGLRIMAKTASSRMTLERARDMCISVLD